MHKNISQIKFQGTYYEMGLQYGKMIKDNIVLPEADTKKLDWVLKCEDEMERYTPGLLDELQGIADAANLEIKDLNAVILYEPFTIKRFVNHTPTMNHCTAFIIPGTNAEGGHPVFARNYDWLAESQEHFAVHRINPANKLQNMLFTDHYVGGFGGVNEAGLACAVTAMPYHNCSFKPGILLNIAVRWILDNYHEVEAAVNFLEEIQNCEGNLYLIADETGTNARVEVSPDKVFTTYSQDEFLGATNHFQSEEMQHLQREIPKSELKRIEGITSWYNNQEKPITIDFVKTILRDHEYEVCAHVEEGGTIWSWIAKLGTNEIDICIGQPCKGNYRFLNIENDQAKVKNQ
ncbi:MAG: C45 family autoproteolytic acyltransferase/hydrolase [Candidatus Hodarchaeales archaeon]|jgi:predicted choloylglycine hydrolase